MFFQLGLRIGGCGRKGRAIGHSSLSSSGIDCAKGQQLQRADDGHGVQRQPPFGSHGDHRFGHRRERGQVKEEGAAHLPLGLYALGQVVGIGRKHMKTAGSPQQATHPRVQERRARRSDHHRPPDAGCKDEGIERRLWSERPQRGSIGRGRYFGRRTTAKNKPFFQKGEQADACRFGIGRRGASRSEHPSPKSAPKAEGVEDVAQGDGRCPRRERIGLCEPPKHERRQHVGDTHHATHPHDGDGTQRAKGGMLRQNEHAHAHEHDEC